MANEDQNPPQRLSLLSNKIKSFECSEQAKTVSDKLQTYYKEKNFCDIVLVAGIGGVKVKAHRMVLSASSDYFQAMFLGNMKEAAADEVELKEVDGDSLRLIVDFMYKASIELHSETVESILSIAGAFQMNSLVAACCGFMGEQLDASNCLGIALFAEQHNYAELHKKASSFACTYFDEVYKENEFLELNEEQLSRYISSDSLFTQSEENIFLSLVAWVAHDKVNREKLIFNLLSHVRFPALKPNFILKNRQSVCQTIECYELVCGWLQWHLSPETRSLLTVQHTKPRKKDGKLIFVSGRTTDALKVQTFNSELSTWSFENWPVPRVNRFDFSITAINKQLIIAGGEIDDYTDEDNDDDDGDDSDGENHATKLVECLDLQTMKWTDLPRMQNKRRNPGVIELNGDLYVVGGFSEEGLRSVEKYDFTTREWQEVAPLLSPPKFEIQVATLDGLLYAISDNTMQCYDPTTNEWTQKAFKNEKSDNLGFGGYAGYLYLVRCGSNAGGVVTVERYHPLNDSWTVISSMPLGLQIKCTIYNNRVIACNKEWVLEYNLETKQWKMLGALLPYDCVSCFTDLFTM